MRWHLGVSVQRKPMDTGTVGARECRKFPCISKPEPSRRTCCLSLPLRRGRTAVRTAARQLQGAEQCAASTEARSTASLRGEWRTGQRRPGGRGDSPGGGWPWRSRAGTPGRAAPDGPGAAPCAGVAWTAGALVRVSGRHCSDRETAPVSRCSGRAEETRVRLGKISLVGVSPQGHTGCGAM